ncbi:MAG: hypothetical protein J7M27_12375 [Candidatus Latescibacteria bacterium]|nr:hypothetical protein [Candidatus Latescibacterota bacterium]OPX25467.1 MAG: hypothetical protein B1H02_01450 [Candidatus Latescibacteria bacterium 4484_107]
MTIEVVLTVAESKRLIAKGVKELDVVRRAMAHGIVAVSKGTTETYVAEELLGEKIEPFAYTLGVTTPKGWKRGSDKPVEKRADLVFRNGKPVEGLSVIEAARRMSAGDVFLKGANALNYQEEVAGILVGDPMGGTIGGAIGPVVARKAHLVIPIGLEKCIPFDIVALSRDIPTSWEEGSKGASLMPVTGLIVTEIEALEILADVEVAQIAAGGIGGAEGSVRLLIEGTPDQVAKAESILSGIYGERAFR